jgi:threonyl-tRNA synthetase
VDQIQEEASVIVKIIKEFYEGLGLWGDHWVSFSVRDPKTPDAYVGFPADWDEAEAMLARVSEEFGLEAKRMEGEAAIYGPKLDFMFKDALGRETQLATVQLDFAMPKRFGLEYTDADGSVKAPVMIHRAILGSFERFIMLLIEHYAGAFPIWLAPEQVRIIAVNDTTEIVDYAEEIREELATLGLRVSVDSSAESVGKKIRAAGMAKVPYTIVVGEKERETGLVSPRLRQGHGEFAGSLSVADFAAAVEKEAATRATKSILGGSKGLDDQSGS